jgi:hypothetical protein
MDASNNVKCPDCDTTVKLGSVGMANLARHRGSEKCKANKKKSNNAKTLKKLQSSMHSFFRPCAPPVPAKVALPSLVESAHTPNNHTVEMW